MPLSKPLSLASPGPDEEESAALVPGSSRRRGPRTLGLADDDADVGAGGGGYGTSLLTSKWRWAILAVALILLRSAYKVGVEVGMAEEDVDEATDLETKKNAGGFRIGGLGKGAKADDDKEKGSTPSPTRHETPPPVPTYKPTEAEPEVKTPMPTFGANDSWVPGPNPYLAQFNTTEWNEFHVQQWKARAANAISIQQNYGSYCPKEPAVAMCPEIKNGTEKVLNVEGSVRAMSPDVLAKGPTVPCAETGDKTARCGLGHPWLNKTIWPLIRGPFCAKQDAERKKKFPLPEELAPYFELGYDLTNTTRSKDAEPFDGGSAKGELPFDPDVATQHFLKFEAMLEHYYEGLARPMLERNIAPLPEDPLYAPMLKAYADQISRAVLRAKDDDKLVIGVLGDSVTAGQDNCYYDAWPEVLRRQLLPLFGAMGLTVEVRNAAKNGGWNLASQMLCAHDMLGASDRNGRGLDFLFQCNPFVKAGGVDGEHMVRRALLGESHTVVSITLQNGMDQKAMLEKYAAAGLSIGTPYGRSPPELGIPEKGFKYWFPGADRAFWGMQGDGFCHLSTRAGSSAVVNRNWHWGPKVHQTYADAYALLLSRAARQSIANLAAGKEPPKPPCAGDISLEKEEPEDAKKEEPETKKEEPEDPLNWHQIIQRDLETEEAIGTGLGGVRCAVGSANQPGSTLLPHWLRAAEGSPFEVTMKARKGTSYVPFGEDANGFFASKAPISGPNGATPFGGWVPNPTGFGAEAPRTAQQCRHVDGQTMVKAFNKPEGVSWLVWEIPKGAVSIGRAMMCHPRGTNFMPADAFDKGDVRFHYAVPNGGNGWKVIEDSHKVKPVAFDKQECMPVVSEMEDADREAAKKGGMWVAVEWKPDGIFNFDYLVAE